MRIFVYDGREFPDPDPNLKVDEVRQHMSSFFPELSNAETKESKRPSTTTPGEIDDIFEFKKRVGTKGYRLGEYPVVVRLFPDLKGWNYLRWLWACTNLSQRILIGTFKPCRLGHCEVDNANYAGGDEWVADMLRHGLCPHCGNPMDRKYEGG